MTPEDNPEDEALANCGQPCDPEHVCAACWDYWTRMRAEGLWVDGKGWTDKGMREMLK